MKIFTKLLVAVLAYGFAASALVQGGADAHGHQSSTESNWSELIASMDKMHMAMVAIEQSADNDADFVRLMIPHHQGAIDMAKVQLLYGKDPQMRRLAQEIITDQQLEIQLMQDWLKAHLRAKPKENGNSVATPKKEN